MLTGTLRAATRREEIRGRSKLRKIYSMASPIRMLVCLLLSLICVPVFADDAQDVAFLTSILQKQLVNVEPNRSAKDPSGSLNAFAANQALKLGDVGWIWRIPAQPITTHPSGGLILTINPQDNPISGNTSLTGMALVSSRDESGTAVIYSTHETMVTPFRIFDGIGRWGLRGGITVPACSFDFLKNPTCFPSVAIANLSATDADAPAITFSISQNSQVFSLPAGSALTLDRSNGPIAISLQAVEAQFIRSVSLKITVNTGPSTDIGPGLALADRRHTYELLASLNDQLAKALAATNDPAQGLQAKTLTAAIHVISAKTVSLRYPDLVRQLLISRARDIADADQRVTDIRNLVIAGSAMTPAQVDLLIVQINQLLQTPNIANADTLTAIRDELVRAKAASANTADAIRVTRDNLYSSVDRMVREYQELILELAQFVTNDDLRSVVDPSITKNITKRVAAADVFISDSTLSGRGPLLRNAFGLPAPMRDQR